MKMYVPLLEVLPRTSSHFQQLVSTYTSTVVAYSDFNVNFYDYLVKQVCYQLVNSASLKRYRGMNQ